MATATCTMTELEGLLGDLGVSTPVPQFSSADVLSRPTDIYRSYLASQLASALESDAPAIYEAIQSTTDISLGDLAVILPRLRLSNDDIRSLPLELKSKLPASPLFQAPFVDRVHLRFFLNAKTLPRLLLSYISSRGASYGGEPSLGLRDAADPDKGRKKVVVEYSSPNVGRSFDERHLRSTLLGAFVANAFEHMGWDVVRLNYLGDSGKDVALLAIGYQRFGSEEAMAADAIGHLLECYQRIKDEFRPEEEARQQAKDANESTAEIEGRGIFAERDAFFKKMEDGDEDALALWKRFHDITVDDLTRAYARLNIRFDEYSGESQVRPETIAEVETALKEKGVLEEIEGAWMIDFPKHGSRKGLGTQVLRQRAGTTSYLLRDIAAVLDRERAYGFDKMVYVVSSRQDLHFAQVAAALELMGRPDLKEKVQHVNFGKVQGLAEHLQDARLLGTMLDRTAGLMRDDLEAKTAADEIDNREAETISDMAAVSALLAQDMSGRRGHAYTFDPKRMVSFEADTGLRLQACHANLSASITGLRTDEVEAADLSYEPLQAEDCTDVLRLLAQYPDNTAATFRTLEPHSVLTYLFRLTYSVAALLDEQEPQDGGPEGGEGSSSSQPPGVTAAEEKKARLVLYETTRQVLENGMTLLGFPIVHH